LGVDLTSVRGSGPSGRITEDDIKAAVRHSTAGGSSGSAIRPSNLPEGVDDQDKWGRIRRQPMSQMRKAIATNMERSASTIPHVTNFDDADITELERIRKGGMADYVDSSVKLTMMAFVMKAVAQSLRLHPLVNASVDMEGHEIIFKDYVHLGVAVDTERGLMVPVVRDVDRMSIPRIAQSLTTIAEQARGGKVSLDEMRGSSFTISNLGAVGGTYSTPIINPPDVAILLVGRSRKLPVVIDDKLEIRLMMPLSLSYDHRIVDGATAARFLNEVINYLKVPGRLLLAP
jgi:pyruvate dehydrogenase E2 component (dihydrolipoamide acetyltransferase)